MRRRAPGSEPRRACGWTSSKRMPGTGVMPRESNGPGGAGAVLRIGEQHPRLRVRVELVVDARVSATTTALHHDDVLRVVDVEDRHPGDRRAGLPRCRVGDVVGADDEGDIAPVELR